MVYGSRWQGELFVGSIVVSIVFIAASRVIAFLYVNPPCACVYDSLCVAISITAQDFKMVARNKASINAAFLLKAQKPKLSQQHPWYQSSM